MSSVAVLAVLFWLKVCFGSLLSDYRGYLNNKSLTFPTSEEGEEANWPYSACF
jgi:hypothetical protein